VRCNKLPVDGAGAVITPDLPCGELGTCRLSMGIAHPRGAGGPWPVVVVEPGGPRPPGADQYLGDFAGLVASQGAVVFVADYREGPRWGGGDPGTYQDIGCAIKFARENAAQYGGDPSRVTLVAHSLGPFFASIVALSPNAFEPPPGTCLAANGSPQPDAFVGIAGVYSTQDVSAQYLDGFFGGTQSAAPEAWNAGDPYAVVAAKSRLDVPVRLVHGAIDNNVIPASSERFEQALEAAGYDSKLVVVPNSDHSGILQDYRTIQAVMDVAALPKR
jgi:acetyl esterase/lipase